MAVPVPLGKSLLGERDLRDVEADLARLRALTAAWSLGLGLLALADLTEMISTSSSTLIGSPQDLMPLMGAEAEAGLG